MSSSARSSSINNKSGSLQKQQLPQSGRKAPPKKPSVPRCGISTKARAILANKRSRSTTPHQGNSRGGSRSNTPAAGPAGRGNASSSATGGGGGGGSSDKIGEKKSSLAGSNALSSDLFGCSGGDGTSTGLLNTAGLGNVNAAAGTSASGAHVKRGTFELEFDRLRHYDRLSDEDVVGVKGFAQMCTELGMAPNSRESFVVAYRLGCAQYGFIRRSEWAHASRGESHMGTLAVTTKNWLEDAADPIVFKEIYRAAFDMVRPDNSPNLKLETAVRMWQLLLTPDIFPLTQVWCVWALQEHKRPVTRDLWKAVWDFSQVYGKHSLDEYEDNLSVLPSALDDFVCWVRRRAAAAKARAAAIAAGQ